MSVIIFHGSAITEKTDKLLVCFILLSGSWLMLHHILSTCNIVLSENFQSTACLSIYTLKTNKNKKYERSVNSHSNYKQQKQFSLPKPSCGLDTQLFSPRNQYEHTHKRNVLSITKKTTNCSFTFQMLL